jgi:hypothetical protein
MSGPRDGETVNLEAKGTPAAIEIGRSVAVGGLALPWDPDTSRTHARLVLRENAWWLEDAGSRNGTFLGEFSAATKPTGPVRLAPGQVFRCGLTRLQIEAEALAKAPAEAVALRGQ